jgi:hypothetical protein
VPPGAGAQTQTLDNDVNKTVERNEIGLLQHIVTADLGRFQSDVCVCTEDERPAPVTGGSITLKNRPAFHGAFVSCGGLLTRMLRGKVKPRSQQFTALPGMLSACPPPLYVTSVANTCARGAVERNIISPVPY